MANYEFDVAAIAIYIALVVNYFHTRKIKNGINRLFMLILFMCMLTPIFDIVRMVTTYKQMDEFTVNLFHTLYFLSQQMVSLMLFMYVFGQVRMHEKVRFVFQAIVSAPVYITFAFIFTNPLHHWIFTYENGVYEWHNTGSLQYISLLVYFIAAVVYSQIEKKHFTKTFRRLVIVIFVLNAVGRTIQNQFQLVYLHSIVVAISVLIIYLYTQKDQNLFDPWTGLMNKAHFPTKIAKYMRNEIPFSLVMVRVADYDLLTSTYGVLNVEQLISEIAKYVQSFVPIGEAFLISNNCMALTVRLDKEADVEAMKQNIYNGLDRVWMINSVEIVCSIFVSGVNYPEHCKDLNDMRAYILYFQKMHRMRYGVVPVEELGLKDKAREQLIAKAVEKAIMEKSFEVYYQPICTTAEKKYVTAEALVRLIDEEVGFVSPGEFIPLAESNGSIVAIGNIVLEKVCHFIANHDLDAMGIEYIEMNLSTVQCLQRNFMDRVIEITNQYKISSDKICFEITETASNCAPKIFTENLELLKERGFRLALDDFGTGYGNLQRMVTSDFDIIKFDKAMVEMTCENKKLHDAFAKMIVMFHSLNFGVVAEGVENYDQFEFLQSVGVDYIQGFLFSRPLPVDEFVRFIERHIN